MRLSGLTEQALSDRPATFGGTTNVIRALKLLACHNSGFHWRTAPAAIA